MDRDLLIGKALFIYWPHSWDQIPGTKIPLPFFPNFATNAVRPVTQRNGDSLPGDHAKNDVN